VLIKETVFVRLLSLKIPSLLFIGPRVLELDGEGCAIRIALGLRTKNHLDSMYLGVLCAGADLASGLNAAWLIYTKHKKDLKADFLKRADGDVVFRSRDGARVKAAIEETDRTGERVTLPVEVVATVPEKYGDEPVARFTMGLSLRRKD
jgi:acyl-coenzyme A thioesterase PaaI-like protein